MHKVKVEQLFHDRTVVNKQRVLLGRWITVKGGNCWCCSSGTNNESILIQRCCFPCSDPRHKNPVCSVCDRFSLCLPWSCRHGHTGTLCTYTDKHYGCLLAAHSAVFSVIAAGTRRHTEAYVLTGHLILWWKLGFREPATRTTVLKKQHWPNGAFIFDLLFYNLGCSPELRRKQMVCTV